MLPEIMCTTEVLQIQNYWSDENWFWKLIFLHTCFFRIISCKTGLIKREIINNIVESCVERRRYIGQSRLLDYRFNCRYNIVLIIMSGRGWAFRFLSIVIRQVKQIRIFFYYIIVMFILDVKYIICLFVCFYNTHFWGVYFVVDVQCLAR